MMGTHDVTRAIVRRLRSLSTDLLAQIASRNSATVTQTTSQMLELSDLLPLCAPTIETLPASSDLTRHLKFVLHFTPKSNWDWALSNARDADNDIGKLEKSVEKLSEGVRPALRDLVAGLPPGDAKDLAEEAVAALGVHAYRAAIVCAGASLESIVRESWEGAFNKRSKRIPLNTLISDLEGLTHGELAKDKAAVVHMVRIYRDLTAHPSEFKDAEANAPPLVELACNMLRQSLGAPDAPLVPAPLPRSRAADPG